MAQQYSWFCCGSKTYIQLALSNVYADSCHCLYSGVGWKEKQDIVEVSSKPAICILIMLMLHVLKGTSFVVRVIKYYFPLY